MARVHTAVAAMLVAAIVLVPFGFWIYAQAASVDRGAQVAHAKRLLADVAPPVRGARRLVLNSYERRDWEGESLVPIKGYTVETAYRLPRPMRPSRVIEHYKRRLAGWTITEEAPGYVTFARAGDEITLDIVEYRGGGGFMRSYGVMVSQ